MKPFSAFRFSLFAFTVFAFSISVFAVTPFYYRGYNSDGTAQTNPVVLAAYPPAVNGITVLGTNIIFGAYAITNTPNSSGFFSNSIYGGTYRLTVPALNFATYAVIPETTNYNALSMYLTNAPVINAVGGYAIITNLLGYAPFNPASYTPATNSFEGIVSALTYTPATNTPATNTIVYVSAVSGITNASGNVTNLSVTLTTNSIYYQQR